MSWVYFSFASVAALAAAELCQQHLLRGATHLDERVSAVLTFLFQALLAAVLIVCSGHASQSLIVFSHATWPWLICVGLISSLAMVFYLRSFRVENISVSCIFISWSVVVSSILGVIFFAESLHAFKLTGILLVLGAVFLLNLKNLNLEPNHYYGLIAGALFGVVYILDKKLVLASQPVVYMFWVFLLIAIFGVARDPAGMSRAIRRVTWTDLKRMLVSGLLYFGFNLCTFSTYTHGGEVGRVDAINNCQVFLIIGVEYLVYGQKEGSLRKIMAAALAVSGVFLLATA